MQERQEEDQEKKERRRCTAKWEEEGAEDGLSPTHCHCKEKAFYIAGMTPIKSIREQEEARVTVVTLVATYFDTPSSRGATLQTAYTAGYGSRRCLLLPFLLACQTLRTKQQQQRRLCL